MKPPGTGSPDMAIRMESNWEGDRFRDLIHVPSGLQVKVSANVADDMWGGIIE